MYCFIEHPACKYYLPLEGPALLFTPSTSLVSFQGSSGKHVSKPSLKGLPAALSTKLHQYRTDPSALQELQERVHEAKQVTHNHMVA
jgi:hypothetical protein